MTNLKLSNDLYMVVAFLSILELKVINVESSFSYDLLSLGGGDNALGLFEDNGLTSTS